MKNSSQSVRYRTLGSTGLQVSEIGFGALEIGRDWAADVNSDFRHLTEREAADVLNGVLDLGINFIDTAPAYWYSEEFIGKAIAHRRSEYVLATKVGEHCDPSGSVYDYSAEATKRFIDASLKHLRTEYIDLLQIHSASIEVLERGETLEAMKEAKNAGKVLHLGMTGGVSECTRALELGGFETVQFPYNLINLAAEERLLDLAREQNAGVIIMRGLAGGKLSQKYSRLQDHELCSAIAGLSVIAEEYPESCQDRIVALAIGYVLARPEVSTVIIGTRRLRAIEQNLQAAGIPVSPELIEKVRSYVRTRIFASW